MNVKYARLQEIIRGAGQVLVAYSGGVDSTFLLEVAYDTLRDDAIGVIGVSPTIPADQIEEALGIARDIGVTVLTVNTDELTKEEFVSNPVNRCFHCKQELFTKLWQIAREKGFTSVVDGCNADDLGDYRPGMKAGHALGVRSPLQEAQMSKEDIRQKSRELGLPTWNQPASPCLSSRFPYGTRINEAGLAKVEQAEKYLKALGYAQVRARYLGDSVRIEVDKDKVAQILAEAEQIVPYLKGIGFVDVTLDREGYRMGSLNAGINE